MLQAQISEHAHGHSALAVNSDPTNSDPTNSETLIRQKPLHTCCCSLTHSCKLAESMHPHTVVHMSVLGTTCCAKAACGTQRCNVSNFVELPAFCRLDSCGWCGFPRGEGAPDCGFVQCTPTDFPKPSMPHIEKSIKRVVP